MEKNPGTPLAKAMLVPPLTEAEIKDALEEEEEVTTFSSSIEVISQIEMQVN